MDGVTTHLQANANPFNLLTSCLSSCNGLSAPEQHKIDKELGLNDSSCDSILSVLPAVEPGNKKSAKPKAKPLLKANARNVRKRCSTVQFKPEVNMVINMLLCQIFILFD